jgi:hypothetical protein
MSNVVGARKAERKDRKIEEDDRNGAQSAEYSAAGDAWAAEDVGHRDEKTRQRERASEKLARKLALSQAVNAVGEQITEFEMERRVMKRVAEGKSKYEQMGKERHSDWLTSQKEKDVRKKEGRAKRFSAKRDPFDVLGFEMHQKKSASGRSQGVLRFQGEEKEERERKDKEEDRAADIEMLAIRNVE